MAGQRSRRMGKRAAPEAELEAKSRSRRMGKGAAPEAELEAKSRSRRKRTTPSAKPIFIRMGERAKLIFRRKRTTPSAERRRTDVDVQNFYVDLQEGTDHVMHALANDMQVHNLSQAPLEKVKTCVRKFYVDHRERTNHVMHALANDVQVRNVSLASIKKAMTCLLQLDQKVVKIMRDQKVMKIIEEDKEDTWSKQKFFNFMQKYFDNNQDLYTKMKNCLTKTRDDQHNIQIELKKLPSKNEGLLGQKACRKVLQKVKSVESIFPEDFWCHFQSVCRQHIHMLNKLKKKLNHARAWRKILNIIFVATFATVLICSVVAAAIAAPHVAAALAAVCAIPMLSIRKWMNSLWKKYEDTIQEQVISVTIKDLETMKDLVERLEGTMRSVEFRLTDREAPMIENIKKKQESFVNNIDDLLQHIDSCSRYSSKARKNVIKMGKSSMKRRRSFSM